MQEGPSESAIRWDGYRPGKSAVDAVHQARQRCWRYDWVLDLDIKGFFDSIDWEVLLKAVSHHTDCPWVLLYIERWLKAPLQMQDGTIMPRNGGEAAGRVISTRSWRTSSCTMRLICGW
jgi:RNA-directed DNA polymerase